jgi:hypothetical protein
VAWPESSLPLDTVGESEVLLLLLLELLSVDELESVVVLLVAVLLD